MGSTLFVQILKSIGVEGGIGIGVVVAFATWLLITVINNKKKVGEVAKRCNGQDTTLIEHGKLLEGMCKDVKHLNKGQDQIIKSLDKLTELHMKG